MPGAYREMTPEEKEIALKPWANLTPDQKIERLRIVLASYEGLSVILQRLQEDVGKLNQHEHSVSGKILTPMLQNGLGIGGLMSKPRPELNQYNRLY